MKRVLAGGSASPPQLERAEKADAHRDDILALLTECKGNLVRVHEELETRGIVTLSYPALTAFCRKHGIGHEPKKPAGRYPFEPGKEMQHDTSPHDADIGGALRRVQTASLVLCHSHRLFFQFYPRFTRFECKLFLNDGAQYDDGTCEHCMVDNSHVKVISTLKQRKTLAAHRPPRRQAAVHVSPLPEERELTAAGAPFADHAKTLKQHAGSRWPIALRRLAQLRLDYPAQPLAAAIETAAHYGLCDLDRLERMILRNIATAYFVVPDERNDPEPDDEG